MQIRQEKYEKDPGKLNLLQQFCQSINIFRVGKISDTKINKKFVQREISLKKSEVNG